jgi:hypothetical protein
MADTLNDKPDQPDFPIAYAQGYAQIRLTHRPAEETPEPAVEAEGHK